MFEDGLNENSPEQIMHYFMFNRIALQILENIEYQLVFGAAPVKKSGLNLICRILTVMASSVKRQNLMIRLRDAFYFVNT